MPPEDSVRSWAMVQYLSLFSLFSAYPLVAVEVHLGAQPLMKVDKEIKQKASEIIAGATTPDDQLNKILDFCRTNIKNTDDKNRVYRRGARETKRQQETRRHAETWRWLRRRHQFLVCSSCKRGWIRSSHRIVAGSRPAFLRSERGYSGRASFFRDRSAIWRDVEVLRSRVPSTSHRECCVGRKRVLTDWSLPRNLSG